MDKQELERLWSDAGHWTSLGLYRCAADPRLIVPKRVKWAGWTINIAHPSSILLAFLLALAGVVPPLLVLSWGSSTFENVFLSFVFSILLVSGICIYFSSKTE